MVCVHPLIVGLPRLPLATEIQPVIHRERVVPVTEHVEQHNVEHIAGNTIHTREVVYEQDQYQTRGLGQEFQQQQSTVYQQQSLNQQSTVSALPMFNPPVTGTPYGLANSQAGTARTGKRHHHGVFHRN